MTKNLDDGYMGSGKRIGYAKKKYGIENFKKEVLSIHDSPEEMLAEEARLVNEEFLGREDVYNLTCGGRGSWFYVNQQLTPEQRTKAGNLGGYKNLTPEQRTKAGKLGGPAARKAWNLKLKAGLIPNPFQVPKSEEHKRKISEACKGKPATSGMSGKSHSEETKQKIREKRALQVMKRSLECYPDKRTGTALKADRSLTGLGCKSSSLRQ